MDQAAQESIKGLEESKHRSRWLGWSSFVFALLQSICALFLATSGIGALIGLGSLAAAVITAPVRSFHQDAIRIPMMLFALVGALFNLYAVWRVRSLRSRPASQWRIQPVTPIQKRSERLQILLSIFTLVLLVIEVWTHQVMHHSQ